MAIFDSSDMEKAGKNNYILGVDFDGEGQVLQIKSVEKIASQFGAPADNSLVERGILQEGQVFRYTFVDKDGKEKLYDSHSMPFMIGLQNAEFNLGDWVRISRTGKLKDTRYQAELVEAPTPLKPEDIGF